ncbi:Pheromone receptor Rcb2 B44 [Mycena venus]|uniref:Pheromone receptor Rcb2 B44 n=1 Tax=Mycena venus TaxID=2733690 RepID=A0A8H7CNU8_9AGAR|nr:Pheromone receptor Rcb2 B44 [Mycena venus]
MAQPRFLVPEIAPNTPRHFAIRRVLSLFLTPAPLSLPSCSTNSPIGAFIAAFLVLVPLPWHWRARNVPTLSIIAWLFFSNIMLGVNALIWADNIRVTARVWCDIATKLQVGATMALPACCLCLCIHLERIASVRQVRTTIEQKHKRMIFDIMMCWGVPFLSMALHYVVQGHRFDIVQDFGCRPATYISIAAICLIWVPQLVVVLLTLLFAGAALYHFFRRRLTFARHLADQSQSALTPSRYFRLMAMAIAQMVWATFLTVTNMVLTCSDGLRPWISWANVHSNFSRVGVFPKLFIPETQWRWTYFIFWTVPITGAMFFAFFAFGQDAVKEYKAVGAAVGRVFRIRRKKEEGKAKAELLPSTAFAARFPVERKSTGTTATDADTIHSQMSKPTHAHDFPLTPLSTSSFGTDGTVIPSCPYSYSTDDAHSLHKASEASYSYDAHSLHKHRDIDDMA